MKRIFTLAASAAIAALALAGCQKNERITPQSDALSFTSSIDGMTLVDTRAADDIWHNNDAIGIYMLDGEGTVLDENKLHRTASGNGTFTAAAGHELYRADEAVDFVAYYPHATLTNNVYPINLSTQTAQASIDLMYSVNVTGYTENSPELVFKHRLSKVVFNVTDTEGVSLVGMTALITGMNSSASFDVLDNEITGAAAGAIDARVSASSVNPTAVVEAIVIPGVYDDYIVTFTLANGSTATLDMADVDYEEGKKYTYGVNINIEGSGPATIISGNGTIENWNDVPGGSYNIEKTEPEIIEEPAITGVGMESIELPLKNGMKFVVMTVDVENKGDALLVVSGLSGILSATIDQYNNRIIVETEENSSEEPVEQTMIITLGESIWSVPVTVAGAVVVPPVTETVTTFTLPAGTADNTPLSLSNDNVSITSSQGSHNNVFPRYWNDFGHGLEIRSYIGNTITFTKASGTLTKIEFTTSPANEGTVTANTGSVSGTTWTGSASSVTFTVAGNQFHFQSLKVTHE